MADPSCSCNLVICNDFESIKTWRDQTCGQAWVINSHIECVCVLHSVWRVRVMSCRAFHLNSVNLLACGSSIYLCSAVKQVGCIVTCVCSQPGRHWVSLYSRCDRVVWVLWAHRARIEREASLRVPQIVSLVLARSWCHYSYVWWIYSDRYTLAFRRDAKVIESPTKGGVVGSNHVHVTRCNCKLINFRADRVRDNRD